MQLKKYYQLSNLSNEVLSLTRALKLNFHNNPNIKSAKKLNEVSQPLLPLH